jgi:hypothetical protein
MVNLYLGFSLWYKLADYLIYIRIIVPLYLGYQKKRACDRTGFSPLFDIGEEFCLEIIF